MINNKWFTISQSENLQCLNVMDPVLFVDWCKTDTCDNHPELSCASIEAFARDCAAQGFCINWRNEHCPAPVNTTFKNPQYNTYFQFCQTCPSSQHFKPCASLKQTTCEDIKQKLPTKLSGLIEGCYCPEGQVLLNSTCVQPKDCEVCDDEGHHPGEEWKKDKCTTCKCEGTALKCDTQFCPGKETVCERG